MLKPRIRLSARLYTAPGRRRGFTLVELLIGMALIGLLLTFAMPNFATMLQNAKIRKNAESMLFGLQSARSEAIKQNLPVEFVMTDEAPVADDVGAYGGNKSGRNWLLRSSTDDGYTFLEGEADNASSSAVTVLGSGGSFNGIVTFTTWGTTTLTSDVAIDVKNPAGGACKTTGGNEPMRCMRVVVTTSGSVRMCDPSVTAAGDTRAC